MWVTSWAGRQDNLQAGCIGGGRSAWHLRGEQTDRQIQHSHRTRGRQLPQKAVPNDEATQDASAGDGALTEQAAPEAALAAV